MINIPLEQQICLLKVNDSVKEKAMVKLKEIKSKSDDRIQFLNKLKSNTPNIKFDIYGMNGVEPIWSDDYRSTIESWGSRFAERFGSRRRLLIPEPNPNQGYKKIYEEPPAKNRDNDKEEAIKTALKTYVAEKMELKFPKKSVICSLVQIKNQKY